MNRGSCLSRCSCRHFGAWLSKPRINPPEATVTTIQAARLTDRERRIIDQARRLADASGSDAVREVTGTKSADPAMIFAEAFGAARVWLLELAERLGGAE